MDRRTFLHALLTGTTALVAGAEFDLDRLLWVPGRKTIFLPPVRRFAFHASGWFKEDGFWRYYSEVRDLPDHSRVQLISTHGLRPFAPFARPPFGIIRPPSTLLPSAHWSARSSVAVH